MYAAYGTGPHGAVGGNLPARMPQPPPAAIFTAAKNKLLDGGGSGAWSPLSPGGTGASAQLAQLLGLFDEQSAGAGGGGPGRSITESSDFILREVHHLHRFHHAPLCFDGHVGHCAYSSQTRQEHGDVVTSSTMCGLPLSTSSACTAPLRLHGGREACMACRAKKTITRHADCPPLCKRS